MGTLQALPTEASSEDRVLGGAVGGMDTSLGMQERRTGKATTQNHSAAPCQDISSVESHETAWSHAASLCQDISPITPQPHLATVKPYLPATKPYLAAVEPHLPLRCATPLRQASALGLYHWPSSRSTAAHGSCRSGVPCGCTESTCTAK